MSLTSVLSAYLGVALVDLGETLWDVLDDADNVTALQQAGFAAVAHALVLGARDPSRDAIACIESIGSALAMRNECDLDDRDALAQQIGECLDLTDVALWIATLIADLNEATLKLLQELVELHEPWPDDGLRALHGAVLPIVAALDGTSRRCAAYVLEAIIKRHRELSSVDEIAGLALPRLCEMLADEGDHAAAAAALGAIGDPRAIAPLIVALRGSIEPRIKAQSTARALAQLRATAAMPELVHLLQTDEQQRDEYIHAILRIDPARGAPAVAQLADPDRMSNYVLEIVKVGAERGDPSSLAFLERATRSADSGMRSRALSILVGLGGGAMLERLCAAVEDPSDEVRHHAVSGLRTLRDPRAFDALVSALRRGHHNAAVALGELGDPRAIAPLVEVLALEDHHAPRDVTMKEAVIEALGDLGRDEGGAWKALRRRLRHDSEHVRACAAIACQQLRPGCRAGVSSLEKYLEQPGIPDHHERVLPPLVRRLDEIARRGVRPHDPDAARSILRGLERLNRHVGFAPLAALIETWRGWLTQ